MTLLGFRLSFFHDPAFFNAGRTVFTKTAAALEQLAGFPQGLLGRIPADPLHGGVPGRNSAAGIHCEYAVGHRIDDPVDESHIPDLMDLFGHPMLPFKTGLALPNVTIRYFLQEVSCLVKKNRIWQKKSNVHIGMLLGFQDEKTALG